MAAKSSTPWRSWRPRLAIEQFVQMLTVVVSILDRVLIAALFYRFWGAQYFEAWSVVLAIVGLISFSHLGFVSYYQNMIAELLQKGEKSSAVMHFRESFTLLVVTSLLGIFCLTVYIMFFLNTHAAKENIDISNIKIAAILMVVTIAAKIPLSNIEALYRASRIYSAYAVILLSGDMLRIALICASILFFNENLLFPALAAFFAITCVQVGYLLYHKSVRFPEFDYKISFPNLVNIQKAFALSSGFFLNTLTTVLLASLPVLMLNAQVEEAGILSAFLVVRILFGLPRTLSLATSIVIGHEASRHLVVSDYKKAQIPVKESSKVIAVVSGIMVGGLLCFGQEFTVFWMGDENIFRLDFAIVAALPALIMPAATIANNVLMTANKAYAAAAARIAQLILFIVTYAALSGMEPAIAILLALGLSEVLGLGFIAKIFCSRLLNYQRTSFFYSDTLLALLSASVIVLLNWLLLEFSQDIFMRIALSAAMSGFLFYFLALDKYQRSALLREVRV